MNIEIAKGPAADRLLADERFLAEWAALCARCHWATAFQGPGYAGVWYATYRHHYEPLLVFSRAAEAEGGALQGLLALAFSPTARRERALIVAGGIQAEYHAWVSTAPLGNTFPWQAVEALRREFPFAGLTFHYLASNAPTGWITGPEGKRRCVLRTHRRPLVVFGDGSANVESLAKKTNKRKLKDLDKMGGLEFKRVTDPVEFENLFDDMVRLYDFRHGAVQGTEPFCTIELQKAFHVAMTKVPGLLHVTTLRTGGRLAAAHFGVASGKELQLGTIVHDPAMAKQSPGKFQILLLCKMLFAEGFERLDLTPGGDTYKERFVDSWDEVHTLAVLPTARRRAAAFVSARAKDAIKGALKRRGVTTAEARHRVKAALWELKRPAALATSLARRAGGWVASRREVRVYCRPAGGVLDSAGIEAGQAPPATARRDALDDLLAYQPAGAGPSRQAFLSAALTRVEEGQHVYTLVEGDRLACCAWLAEHPGAETLSTLLPGMEIPPNGAILHGFQSFAAAAANAGASVILLRSMLRDALRATGVRQVFLIAAGDAAPSPRLAGELGFADDGALVTEIRLGRRCSSALGAWARTAAEPTVPAPAPAQSASPTAPAGPTAGPSAEPAAGPKGRLKHPAPRECRPP